MVWRTHITTLLLVPSCRMMEVTSPGNEEAWTLPTPPWTERCRCRPVLHLHALLLLQSRAWTTSTSQGEFRTLAHIPTPAHKAVACCVADFNGTVKTVPEFLVDRLMWVCLPILLAFCAIFSAVAITALKKINYLSPPRMSGACLPDNIACDHEFPSEVAWIDASETGEEASLGASSCGCRCEGPCTAATCPCIRGNPSYDAEGRLLSLLHGLDLPSAIYECGPACTCRAACPCAVTARGARHRLRLHKTEGKGWGVAAAERIAQGAFLCEYAGEFLTTPEAQRRLREYDAARAAGQGSGHALLVAREVLPSGAALRSNIDATRRRNAAGFMNHR